MPARIIINPVVVEDAVRRPLCGTLADPGRPGRNLVHVSAISDGLDGQRNDDCLSVCAGVDMSNLDAAAGVTILFETGSDRPLAELRTWLTSTPNELGWTTAKQVRIRDRLIAYGADVTGITGDTALWHIVNRLGRVWSPTWDVRAVRTWAAGA